MTNENPVLRGAVGSAVYAADTTGCRASGSFTNMRSPQVYISARSNVLEQGLMQKKPQIMQEIQSSGCYMGVEAREGVGWDGQPCTEGAQQVSANQGT